jgi:hypothetical protein
MPWGSVTITFGPSGYNQNYKRSNVVTHKQCQQFVAAAVADSVLRINIPGAIVNRNNIAQNQAVDPGITYRLI